MRHTFRGTWSGLKCNMAMTIVVIVTVSAPLSFFGVGLSTSMEADLVKDRWYDKVEISVFLYVEHSTGGTCGPERVTTNAQCKVIEEALKVNPEVKEVFYESREEAFKESQRVFKDFPALASRTVEQMQDSFRIKLLNPENYKRVVNEVQGLQGVQNVRDLKSVLDPMFNTLDGLQWAMIGMSVLLLLTAALQISITTRMAAFTRRCEIGIMRLVGAFSFYILLPFLLGSFIAGLIGVLISSSLIVVTYPLLIEQATRPSIPAIAWIGVDHILNATTCIAMVGVALPAIPMPLATRRYLRIWRVRRSRRTGSFPIYPRIPSSVESPAVRLPRS